MKTNNWLLIVLTVALTVMGISIFVGGCAQDPSISGISQGPAGPQGPTGATGPQGPAGPVATPTASITPSVIDQMVANQNAYLYSIGQPPLVAGLSCTLYTVPTSTTDIVGATLTQVASFSYTGVFNQLNLPVTAGFNVLPLALQPIYQTWFVMKCTGQLVVTDNNWHNFSLSSDDGSNLYIDGSLLIGNDGQHAIETVAAAKLLTSGFHSFELDFFQAAGEQALILDEDGAVMGSSGFYY
jgi:hypothetical protein